MEKPFKALAIDRYFPRIWGKSRVAELPFSNLIYLWLVAAIPRLAISLIFLNFPIALDDMFQYDMLARSLIEGKGYRWYGQEDLDLMRPYLSQFIEVDQYSVPPEGLQTTFRAPGYPFFLAGLYTLIPLGQRFAMARVVQAALSTFMAPLAALLAIKLKMNRRAALMAGLGMALYPILLFYPVGLASENLFIPLLLGSILVLIGACEKEGYQRTIVAGVILGALMLTRSILAPFVFLSALWLWRYGKTGWRGPLLLLITAFGLCLPWSVRNSVLMSRPAFVENSLGYNLFVGYHPEGNGAFVSSVAVIPLTILDDAQRDMFCTQSALKFILDDPGEAAWRVIRRAAFFFGLEDRELIYFYSNNFFGNLPTPVSALAYGLLVTPWIWLGLFTPSGFIKSPKHPAKWLILALLIAYSMPHLLVLSEPRFHLALVPALIPFAAYGFIETRRQGSKLAYGSLADRREAWIVRLCTGSMILLWAWGLAMQWGRLLAVLGPGGNELLLSY